MFEYGLSDILIILYYFRFRNRQSGAKTAPLLRFLDHTQTHTHTHTFSRTPLNEWSARRRGCQLHNKHKIWTSTFWAEFKPVISGIKRPQTYASDRTANGISCWYDMIYDIFVNCNWVVTRWQQYSTIQYSTVQCSTVQYSTVQYSTVQYSTVQFSTVQYSTVRYSKAQCSTVQYSKVKYSAVQYSTVQ